MEHFGLSKPLWIGILGGGIPMVAGTVILVAATLQPRRFTAYAWTIREWIWIVPWLATYAFMMAIVTYLILLLFTLLGAWQLAHPVLLVAGWLVCAVLLFRSIFRR